MASQERSWLFTEEIIREMHKHCPRPIVMPLSNPTSRVEATPQDIIASITATCDATGSPFNPVVWKDKIYPIAQCNNAFIFPGIGLGVIASGASRITDEMLMSASEMLAQYSPLVLNGERSGTAGAGNRFRNSPRNCLCGWQNGAAARRGGENVCRSSATGH
ncbi:malic enzyme-like NAD(P)-binding protein [Escherichia coli]